MKYIFLFLFFAVSLSVYSQNIKEVIVGEWQLEKKLPPKFDGEFFLRKGDRIYGTKVLIKKNKQIREKHIAPCGMDSQMFRSAKKGIGQWSIDTEKMILRTSFSILQFGKRFKIVNYSDTEITLRSLDK